MFPKPFNDITWMWQFWYWFILLQHTHRKQTKNWNCDDSVKRTIFILLVVTLLHYRYHIQHFSTPYGLFPTTPQCRKVTLGLECQVIPPNIDSIYPINNLYVHTRAFSIQNSPTLICKLTNRAWVLYMGIYIKTPPYFSNFNQNFRN